MTIASRPPGPIAYPRAIAIKRNAKKIAAQMTSAPQPQTQFFDRTTPRLHAAHRPHLTQRG